MKEKELEQEKTVEIFVDGERIYKSGIEREPGQAGVIYMLLEAKEKGVQVRVGARTTMQELEAGLCAIVASYAKLS